MELSSVLQWFRDLRGQQQWPASRNWHGHIIHGVQRAHGGLGYGPVHGDHEGRADDHDFAHPVRAGH